jgi:hypothetical protein
VARSLADLQAAYGAAPAAPAAGAGSRSLDELAAAYAPPEPEKEEPGLLESGLRGIKQGVTLGFGDEITAALEQTFSNTTYKQARDEARANDAAAREAHPVGFGLGEILGNVGIGVATGGVAGAAAKLGVRGVAGLAGAEGALQGVGSSDSTNAGDLAREALVGGATGAALGAAGSKIFGRYAGTAVERHAKHIAEDVTQGSNMVNKRRFAQVQELAADVFDQDKPLRKALGDPEKALDMIGDRLGTYGKQTVPLYQKVDQAYRPMMVSEVTAPIDAEIARYAAEPGKETIASALGRIKDNFVAATTRGQATPNLSTPVPTQLVRRWTSNLLSEADSTMGSLAETERYQVKDQLHKVADGILKDHLEAAAQAAPGARDAVGELRELNKKLTVLIKAKDVIGIRAVKESVGHQGLGDILKSTGLPGIAALAGAGGNIISGGAYYAGTKAAIAAGRATNRGATTMLAQLMKAAQAGSVPQQLALDAVKAGVPNAAVQGALGLARKVASGLRGTPGGFVAEEGVGAPP